MITLRPATERELIDLLHTLRDSNGRLGRDAQLDRGALTAIEDCDTQSMLIDVQAGATLTSIEAALNSQALSLGALPPAAWSCTVANYLEGPYAGLRAIAGGRLEPLCARLDGVFADGRHFTSSPGPRSAAGPDLKALFLGASGRLGLVTRAQLRACAAAEAHAVLIATFTTPREAVEALTTAIVHGALLSRIQLHSRAGHIWARIEWSGSRTHVERDRDVLHRAMPNHDPARSTPFVAEGPTRETTWHQVEAALRENHALELHRVSLTSLVSIGEVEGLSLETPGAWSMPVTPSLLARLDPTQLLGGAP